jgi:hypothetical protein
MASGHLEDAFASVISPGVKLSIALYHFASPLGIAGDAMKDVGAEVTLFCATMRNVRFVFKSPKSFRISTTALHDVRDVLSRGKAIFEKVEALLNKLRNDDEGADLYSRVEDTFRKSKVLMWKESLRSCTAMVQVMLTTMAFAERLASAGKGHSPSTENDELRDLMQGLLLAQQSTNARLERLEDQTQLDEMQDAGSSNPDRLGPGHDRGHRRNRSSQAILGIATDGTADLFAEGAQRTSILLNRKIYHEDDFKESQRRTLTSLDDHRQSVVQSNKLLQTWTDQLDPSPPYMLSFHGEYAADAYKLIELQEDIRRAEQNRDRDRDTGADTETGRNSDMFHEAATTPYNDWDDGSSGARGESNNEDKNFTTQQEGITVGKSREDGPRDGGGRGEQAKVEDRVPAIASLVQYPTIWLGQGFVTDTTPKVQSWQQVKNSEPSIEIFKSFRVSLEDPCWKVLPAALRKYKIDSDARFYTLCIEHGDQKRYIEPRERPLAIFKDLESKGLKPMFKLKKLSQDTRLDPQLTSMRSTQPPTEDSSLAALTSSLK